MNFFLYFVVDVIKSLFLQDKAHGGIYVCWEVKYMYPLGMFTFQVGTGRGQF